MACASLSAHLASREPGNASRFGGRCAIVSCDASPRPRLSLLETSYFQDVYRGVFSGRDEDLRRTRAEPETLWKATACGAAALIASALVCAQAAGASDEVEVGTLFQRTCAGCHTGGGNILQPNATLFSKDLDRNGLSSVDDIFKITYFGKSRMPGYGETCAPRGQCTFGPRLADKDIRALAEFVKSQADQGWKNVPS